MAILYHVLENEEIKHFARLYYWVHDNDAITSEYKDLLLPGNTMIHAISLEQDSILYSREPDKYRFRIASLPLNVMDSPHSEKAAPILLTVGQTGDQVKENHQPNETELYTGLLCKLYSPNLNTFRVFSLDIHRTKKMFYTSVTITDGLTLDSKEQGVKIGKWVHRDRLNSKVIIDGNLEYMAFSDGPHFHHEPTEIEMPEPSLSRSKYAKTMVASLIRNNFQTLDFTDHLDALLNDVNERKHLYKREDGSILPEFFHSMQSVDSVEPSETAYDATDIRGVQLNANGTLLAVWIKSKSVYIYKRGSADRPPNWKNPTASYLNAASPHHLEKPLEWILRMVITPKEGQIGTITPIGAAMFWEENNSNYISIGMKNNIVNTYLIDQVEDQKAVNFESFLRDKWDLWMVMALVVGIFVANEYKTYLD
ncbi:hypothetical protein BDF21DRAFT_27843 [Thamnidium elegans]|nr:hypothetical protein BDF21DRAFT_27843 [Thamnidium elegans]